MFHQSPLAILPHLPYHARPFDAKGKFQPIDLECTSKTEFRREALETRANPPSKVHPLLTSRPVH